MSVTTCDETPTPADRLADCRIAARTVARETSFGIAAAGVRLEELMTSAVNTGPKPRRTSWSRIR